MTLLYGAGANGCIENLLKLGRYAPIGNYDVKPCINGIEWHSGIKQDFTFCCRNSYMIKDFKCWRIEEA